MTDRGAADERDESETERLDRNWTELLQELRVTQTGTQILTGFLLTIPFQARFSELGPHQLAVYLVMVVLAALATVLAIAPVALHRALFRQGAKDRIVLVSNRLLIVALACVSLTLTGSTLLIFDVVAGRTAGLVAGAATFAVIALTWLALPAVHRTRLGSRWGRPRRQ